MQNLNEEMLAAVSSGDLEAVRRLVSEGADINYQNRWETFAMFTAAWEGNVEALDLLYSLGAKITYHNGNLLCNAAYNGKTESVRWLLAKGEDANFCFSDTGENALHYTISKRSEMTEREEIVKLLIEAGADVSQKTTVGQPTLCFMRDAFLKAETPLHRAAAYGSIAIVRMLIEAGADPAVKDANGDTPISWGSWHLQDSDVLRLLVYEGVAGI